ncbi:UvrABC system protein C [Peptoclostridium acidaminophilum DSM 3953]|uniref:UvrABC system protein C n=2 Tax=Peptoclostridium acidaminophilum TaxID=1731 RepID=W8T1X4_PEPAC|nr:excinuclease ABC subunit UvrC [Peptoclostridium acidaminophilum]AHM55729.1 UvrABC system protein C [Peptoclostridium acidaminophilum DSM 3953]CAC39227.1 UvrC protein [Peptoclostridium acidaminophilum DSM 3953]
MFDIKKQLSMLPDSPGVYIMKDSTGDIIYIGKAKSLKNRVRQYFGSHGKSSPKVEAMVGNISEFEYIMTDSELEALILECNLIKKHRPKYNIIFRDDKTYPFIKVSVNEDYPRVLKVRSMREDGAKYFGPYTSEGAVNDVISLIRRIYPIRKCKNDIKRMIQRGERPCINYDIGKCTGPCRGIDAREQYMQMIDEIVTFLSGRSETLIESIEQQMQVAAERLDFEKAAYFRDKIGSLRILAQRQKIVSKSSVDQDFIAAYFYEGKACIQVFFVREGRIIGREHFVVEDVLEEQKGEVFASFIKHFYSYQGFIPSEILIESETGEDEVLQSWLESIKGRKVHIKVPQKGEKREMIEMVKKNARESAEKFSNVSRLKDSQELLEELRSLLELEETPNRIEAFDISNIQGVDSVGSMVVFTRGRKDSKEYRRFRIKTVQGPDDYSSLYEIVLRRLKKWSGRPDLMLIDGGRGQVGVVSRLLLELGVDIPVWGMYKDDKHRTRGLVSLEREIELKKSSQLYRFICTIQDEAHRFAIDYHRSLRHGKLKRSVLDDIAGVGEKRKLLLISHFRSVENIRNAKLEELKAISGISAEVAERIYMFFREEGKIDRR